MRLATIVIVVLMSAFAATGSAFAFTRTAEKYDGGSKTPLLSTDCVLNSANLCAGWIWALNDVEGAVWGTVLDPAECYSQGLGIQKVTQIALYTLCSATAGRIDNVAISRINAQNCRTDLVYESGPITVVHCVSGDHWTIIQPARPEVGDWRFAVTVTWGPGYHGTGTTSDVQLATDNGIANLYCEINPGVVAFPGCGSTTSSCAGWSLQTERSFVYVSDVNGHLEDLCARYGVPAPLSFPYLYPYGYLPNNLMVSVGIDVWGATAVQPTSWGHVKSLFQ